jgi:hypothetical protein
MRPRKFAWVVFGLSASWVQGLSPHTYGQGAIAFVPIPAPAVSGQTMTVTPVVSPDRRYVRLSVNAYFNAINGFTNYTAHLGAVSGGGGAGGGGGGLGGGLGGLGGGLGGGGGGGGGVAGFGDLDAGMNGVIGLAGFSPDGIASSQIGFVVPFGEMRAGPAPFDGAFDYGDSIFVDALNAGAESPGWNGSRQNDAKPNQRKPSALTSQSTMRPGRSTDTSSARTDLDVSARPSAHKSSSLRQSSRRFRSVRAAESSDVEPIVKPKKKD